MIDIERETIIPINGNDARRSAEEMDEERQKTMAYEYLCHLEEAKKWMEACLREKLPPTTQLEENLRNGVYLAKIAHFMDPKVLPLNKIYDIDQKRYSVAGLQFKHTDNINYFLKCLKSIQLPLTFQPETTDVYDKKNMPRVIYCIHALSTHLFKLGKAPQIQDLYGKVNFTDAEINAVSAELKKYGIQMPSFQKIGGLLTNSMAGDTAALHAAVIAINQSLTDSNKTTLLNGLSNPTAHLKNIYSELIDCYYDCLLKARDIKMQGALNRSLNDSYVPDAYDELLTQAEIQGHINNVNTQKTLEKMMESLMNNQTGNLINLLKESSLQLQRISSENVNQYKKTLLPLVKTIKLNEDFEENIQFTLNLLQKTIDEANDVEMNKSKRQTVMKSLNVALEKNSIELFYKELMSPYLQVSSFIDDFAVPLYFEEMKIDHQESNCDISYEDIVVSIRVLTAIASVSKAIDTGNPELVYDSLNNPETHITNLDEGNKVKYYRSLTAIRTEHQNDNRKCPILSYIDIQECIDSVNEQCSNDNGVIDILKDLNEAVLCNDRSKLMNALTNNLLNLHTQILPNDFLLYLKLFKNCLKEYHSDGSQLWLEDVENIVKTVESEVQLVQRECYFLGQINKSLQDNENETTIELLYDFGINISDKYHEKCLTSLKNLLNHRKKNYSCPYCCYITPSGVESYLDLEKFTYTWNEPKTKSKCCYLTRKDIDKVIKDITSDVSFDEKMLIKLQACIRGYLLRKRMSERLTFFYENQGKIVKIQAWWRGITIRRNYKKLLAKKRKNVKKRVAFKVPLDYYRQFEDKIIKIQAFWRGKSARRAFVSLLRMEKPPFPVVKHFSTILNFNAEDYDKDFQLQQLKYDVVQAIKHNQNLSQQLNSMDIKIGLLIQNRITLQDVVAHGKNLENLTSEKHSNRSRKNSLSEIIGQKGLKSLTKEGRKMLESYQHFFYALQTNPNYLAKLIFLLPQSKTNKFLQNVILTLYNFGSNMREEYLLLKLFGCALEEEIKSKFQKPSEVVTGNPLVLKMVVNYARQLNGQRALRQILEPVIEKILSDKSISIETNPVDIYKCWRNQIEMETGETSELAYSVTHQEALNYDEVKKRLSNGIKILENTVLEFLNRITESRDLIPYGMLYIAKILYKTLTEKFKNAQEKDILKVVGNLIYYHFINAAIVAPDAFDIITLPVDRSLSNDQRRNLASIAKILQFAASKKGFGEEATHLVCLNPFIINCHEKFKSFFRYCCQIEELEDHFSIHEYTEATLIQKPEIYISIQEICDTHSLVLEYQYEIAPDPKDQLHELLDDLESPPTVKSLMGITEPIDESTILRLSKTELSLVLSNKFQVPENNNQNLQNLFIKAKELLVSILPFLNGDTLVNSLKSNSTTVQQQLYYNKYSSIKRNINIIHYASSSLNDCKLQLQSYLYKLQVGGLVSHKDGYQNIITAVAKDLCYKGKYRNLRNKELQTLRITRQRLQEKTKYYAEQVDYYNEYIKRCLENLHKGNKGSIRSLKIDKTINHHNLRSKVTLKYSAAKLFDKGILLDIIGLPQGQFKNVIFEISPTENYGILIIKGKFMGVEMEKIEIDIQTLLELQFEGATRMDLFGKAKINVNLLLYLLNRKFYGKT